MALLLWGSSPLSAGLCTDSQATIFWAPAPGSEPRASNCDGGGIRCYEAESLGRFVRLANPNCNPQIQGCTVQVGVRFKFPGVEDMVAELLSAAPTPLIDWRIKSSGKFIGGCGGDATGGKIGEDVADTFIEFAGETCESLKNRSTPLKVVARVCSTSTFLACRFTTIEDQDVFLGGQVDAERLGCPSPTLVDDCPTNSCTSCVQGTSVAGGGAQVNESTGGDSDTGPHALLRYIAGGTGRTGDPGATEWRTTLGRYWSHDYAERIVPDPDDTHVWLITRFGSFREYSSKDAGGVYQEVSPSDEYRTLTRTAGGWELRDLEGTVQAFDNEGQWVSTTDRNANATTAGYDAFGVLETVSFPDGRMETFTYHADGKL